MGNFNNCTIKTHCQYLSQRTYFSNVTLNFDLPARNEVSVTRQRGIFSPKLKFPRAFVLDLQA